MGRKLLLEDAHGEREFLLVGTLTVGRDPRCEISANDPLLSRRHAEFVETASGVLVRDLHSQNGIKVNDIAVKEAALRSGDIVQVARMTLRFLEEASPEPSASADRGDDDKTEIIKGPPQLARGAGPAASAGAPAAPLPPTPVPPGDLAPNGAPPGDAGDDRTNMISRPASLGKRAAPHASPSAGTPASAAGSPSRAGSPSAPAQGPPPVPDDERTRVVQPPAAAPKPDARRDTGTAAPHGASGAGVAPPPQAAVAASHAAASRAAADAQVEPPTSATSTARLPRGSWASRVLLLGLLLGLLCSLASAVPLMYWHQQQMNAVALSRATTLASWFAAEAAAALEGNRDASAAVETVSREAGIVAARVLTPDGHVIAPTSRSDEVVSGIPGVNATPADVTQQQYGWNGGLLEIVQPVHTSRGSRPALAWITLNPATEFGGSSLVIVAPAVVAAVFIAWIVAMLITRPTLRALGHLNEDVELALSGRLETVTDPLGAKPVKELTDTITYLAARLRTTGMDVGLEKGRRGPFVAGGGGAAGAIASGGAGASGAGSALPSGAGASGSAGGRGAAAFGPSGHVAAASSASAAASAAVAQAAPPSPAAAAGGSSGQLIVDTAFRVVQATPPCAALLGTSVDALVGRHLLDAIADRLIVDAVLGCLSALPPAGDRDATATDAAGRGIVVAVSRTGKDQPVTITLRVTEAPHA